jgi:tRNA(Ile)-lysidine synthase
MSPLHERASQDTDSLPAPALVRPLLGISKAEILDYLSERQLTYRIDETNADPAFLRNWIRLELLPLIVGRVDAGWPQRLARQAALLRDEDLFMDRLARVELERLRTSAGVDRELLACQDPALQRRMLRLWIAENRGHLRGIDFSHIEQLLDVVVHGAPNARLSIPGGWELANAYERVRLEKRSRKGKEFRYSYSFRAGEVLHVPEAGMAFASKRVSVPPAAAPCMPVGLDEALFDAALLSENLTVRNFCPGDRYRPLGMKGHKKVKDLFIEKKVPLSVRSVLPLFSMGDEILWIPAYARSDTAKIGPQTTEFLHVRAVPLER